MSIDPIVIPEKQFCDADGMPYAGGTLATYVPGTSTPKQSWQDPGQTALNTNPVVLDSAGRCILYGDGEYRLILRDAAGNEVWDITATTIVSAAMAPVVMAPTIADAVHLLGIDDMIAGEAAARSAADSTLQSNITAEATARAAADTTLQANIDAEKTRAMAAEATLAGGALSGGGGYAHLAGGNLVQWGSGATTGGTGSTSLSFPVSFASVQSVVATTNGNAINLVIRISTVSSSGFAVFIEDTNNSGGKDSSFYWTAHGTAP